MGQTIEEILMSRDTLTFVLQSLGFVINLKKSVLQLSPQMEFLGLIRHLTNDYFHEKIQKIVKHCQELYQNSQTTYFLEEFTYIFFPLEIRVPFFKPEKCVFSKLILWSGTYEVYFSVNF